LIKKFFSASSVSALTVDDSEDCFAGLPETSVDSEMLEVDDCDDDEEDEEEGSCPSHDSFHVYLEIKKKFF
jgi:hypothetical protein